MLLQRILLLLNLVLKVFMRCCAWLSYQVQVFWSFYEALFQVPAKFRMDSLCFRNGEKWLHLRLLLYFSRLSLL
jgi:hypothetical protein